MGDRDLPETGASLSTRLLPGIPDSLSRETFLFCTRFRLSMPLLSWSTVSAVSQSGLHTGFLAPLTRAPTRLTFITHWLPRSISQLQIPVLKGRVVCRRPWAGPVPLGLALPPASPGSPNAEAVCESRAGPSVPRPPSPHSTPRSQVSLYHHLPSLAAEDLLNHVTRDPRRLVLGWHMSPDPIEGLWGEQLL